MFNLLASKWSKCLSFHLCQRENAEGNANIAVLAYSQFLGASMCVYLTERALLWFEMQRLLFCSAWYKGAIWQNISSLHIDLVYFVTEATCEDDWMSNGGSFESSNDPWSLTCLTIHVMAHPQTPTKRISLFKNQFRHFAILERRQ